MEIDEILDYALQLPDSEESTPFGPDTIVVKTNGKIFIVLNLRSEPISVNYKADPEQIIIHREDYPQFILPGYHMNKIHWNTLIINRQIPAKIVKDFIKTSHFLVSKKTKKKTPKSTKKSN